MDDVMVERFLEDGFVRIEGAFPPRVAADCARLLWKETGCAPDDPATWTDPVRWISGMAQGPFAAAVRHGASLCDSEIVEFALDRIHALSGSPVATATEGISSEGDIS